MNDYLHSYSNFDLANATTNRVINEFLLEHFNLTWCKRVKKLTKNFLELTTKQFSKRSMVEAKIKIRSCGQKQGFQTKLCLLFQKHFRVLHHFWPPTDT